MADRGGGAEPRGELRGDRAQRPRVPDDEMRTRGEDEDEAVTVSPAAEQRSVAAKRRHAERPEATQT
eukprot:8450072-Alexandrium_andersonii.AAC.1